MNTTETDVLIIGAGPSGTAAASILHQAGLKVTIVEKTIFPRFVIGESLLPRCMDLLHEADLLEAVKAKGFQKKYGAKFISRTGTCDFNFSEQYTKGWDWTWQVTRADFDKVLADTVESRGVEVLYETSVDAVSFENGVTTSVSKHGESREIKSKYIIDGSGYGRVLPRLLDLEKPSMMPPRAALFSHLKDTNRPENEDGNRIQIIVIKKDVWAWVIPFSNGNTSIGFVGNLDSLDYTGNNNEIFEQILNSFPYLQARFPTPEYLFPAQKIAGYACAVKKFHGEKFVLVGNSTEFLDPVFSSGVTLALESGVKAAHLVIDELQGKKVDWDNDYVKYMNQGVDTFRAYVDAWYDGTLADIFFAENGNQQIKDKICSVLAGYVWDMSNPYVKKPKKSLKTLAKIISL